MSQFTEEMEALARRDEEKILNRLANLRKSRVEREAAAEGAGISVQALIRRRQREYNEQQEQKREEHERRESLRAIAHEADGWTLDSDQPAASMPFALKLKQ